MAGEDEDLPTANGDEGAEEESLGTLAPSAELEEALREATEALEARESGRQAPEEPAEAPEAGGEGAPKPATVAAMLRDENIQLKDRLLRLQADFDNLRKRTLKERQDAFQFGHENLVKDLLGTVDNLDRAIDHASQSGDGDFEGMLQGLELVQRELFGALAKHGVSEVDAEGAFDPTVHEAMAQTEDETVPDGGVVQVLQKGYLLRNRLLRPARVIVAKAPEAGKSEHEQAEE